jgi:hypothetical protein
MAFTLIRPESRPWIGGATADDVTVAEADRVALLLRGDYERWSRWAFGLAAFVVTAAGVFVGLGMVDAIVQLGGPPALVDVVATVVAAILAAVAAFGLVRLWLTGRALTTSAAAWLRASFPAGARKRRAGGWVQARTVYLEPRNLVRLLTSSLAFVTAIFGIAAAVRDLAGGNVDGLSSAAGVIGLIALACGLGQAGGVLRIGSGVAEGDPLWHRIRSVLAPR